MTITTEVIKEPTNNRVRWTSADLELFPNDDTRYEIIDGELLVTRALHYKHQSVIRNLTTELTIWSRGSRLGEVSITPGVIFADDDNVIPDLVWTNQARLANILDDRGHFTAAPDLVVEVLSEGVGQERRDRKLKLKLYSVQGVREYWIIDWRMKSIQIYHRKNAVLVLIETLFENDSITSPLLPDFACKLIEIFE